MFNGTRSEDGRTYDIVHVLPDDAPGIDIWIDAETHYVAGIADHEGMPRSTAFSDFREVDGVITPFEAREDDVTSKTNHIDMQPDNPALFLIIAR